MSTGNYGVIRPADLSPDDIEIFYHYTPSRDDVGDVVINRLDSNQVLVKVDHPDYPGQVFGGMYTLKLPSNIFGKKGIFTLIFKPVEIRTKIVDCGVLAARPDIKGLIFDIGTVPSQHLSKFENGGLVGYRIEYINPDPNVAEKKIQNLHRIITSANKVEPVSQNLNNTIQKSLSYRFNNNATLLFTTLTPSSGSTVRPNLLPFIGQPGQNVIITNTFFDPFMVEINMVEYDDETLAIGLFGNQSRSINDGAVTLYNFDNEIYKQWRLEEVLNTDTGNPQFEIKRQLDKIDFSKDFDIITEV